MKFGYVGHDEECAGGELENQHHGGLVTLLVLPAGGSLGLGVKEHVVPDISKTRLRGQVDQDPYSPEP